MSSEETRKTEPPELPKPEMPSYEKLAQSANVLLARNTALETEIGRQHMLLRAYEQQFADMREAIRISNSHPVQSDVTVKT